MADEYLEKISKQIRQNLLDVLDLWSSKENQLKCQKDVPIANVSAELFCQWDDNYYPETEIHKIAFNEKERKTLIEFNLIFDKIHNKTPTNLPPIEEFVLTNEWSELNRMATKTMKKIYTC